MEETKYCLVCDKHVEPDYITKSLVAQYGSIVVGKGYCPVCGSIIVKEHIIDDDGLRPHLRKW